MHYVTAVHTYPTDVGAGLYSIGLTDFNWIADKVTVTGFRAQIVRHVVIAEQETQVLLNGHKIPHPDVLSGLERLVRNTIFIQDFGDGTVVSKATDCLLATTNMTADYERVNYISVRYNLAYNIIGISNFDMIVVQNLGQDRLVVVGY